MLKKLLLAATVWFAFSPLAFSQSRQEQTAIDFLMHLKGNEFKEAYGLLADSMQAELSSEALMQLWYSVQVQLGVFKDTSGYISEAHDQGQRVYIGCIFEKMPLDFKISLNSNNRIEGFFIVPPVSKIPYKAPAYDRPALYTEIKISLKSGDYTLQGTLTVPAGKSKNPLLVMAQGSGPNDRDSKTGPNKPLRDIAVGLAEKGIATLRYDKRTFTYGTKFTVNPDSFTVWEECIQDVLAAIEWSAGREEIDSSRLFFMGHSLSAMLAPRIAQQSPRLKGIILAAAPARPLEDLLVEQYLYLSRLDTTGAYAEAFAELHEQVAVVKSEDLTADYPTSLLPLGLPAPYWIDLKYYDQVATAKALHIPILVLQGKRDYQVPLTDYDLWKKALAGKKNVTFRLFNDMNHILINGQPGSISTPAEYQLPGNVSPEMIGAIDSWIKKIK